MDQRLPWPPLARPKCSLASKHCRSCAPREKRWNSSRAGGRVRRVRWLRRVIGGGLLSTRTMSYASFRTCSTVTRISLKEKGSKRRKRGLLLSRKFIRVRRKRWCLFRPKSTWTRPTKPITPWSTRPPRARLNWMRTSIISNSRTADCCP